ncbi:tyrosine-type recombinase/integrase [Sphaerisporangium fuscum]|uniref:tyrosine-type recombinase/integrase n=1 Tax=Sphaerisporangium fuscum TaxID=2835868 RepID=UPI001BDD97AE|nr:tyrosine-type recombinase/integrase [Sphaerisporangium fuscum]
MKDMTYDVRVYKTAVYKGKKSTTYYVRWKVGNKTWKKPFRNAAQADTYRGEIQAAARKGEAFSLLAGEPISWNRAERSDVSWYGFACMFVDMKWKGASAKYRQDIARALTAATPAMLASERGKPDGLALRTALRRWGFNTKQRDEASGETAEALRWLSVNTKPVSALTDDPVLVRALIDTATSRLDGKRAATSTVLRNKTILQNALDYAVELKLLQGNPLKGIKWKAPKNSHEVDRRSVVNHAQARALLAAVEAQKPSGKRLVAFFALMYYAALRPEEVVNLRDHNITLPPLVLNEETGEWEESGEWGELHFAKAAPFAGREWTDGGTIREERSLKHRADGHARPVPISPALVRILRAHLAAPYGKAADGRLFSGVRGGELPSITYRRVWAKARRDALTPEEAASPIARRVYDLRHACVSTWLNAGVAPTQVAEWAGHSVEVLLRIYAKCIVGQDEAAKRRIADALQE